MMALWHEWRLPVGVAILTFGLLSAGDFGKSLVLVFGALMFAWGVRLSLQSATEPWDEWDELARMSPPNGHKTTASTVEIEE